MEARSDREREDLDTSYKQLASALEGLMHAHEAFDREFGGAPPRGPGAKDDPRMGRILEARRLVRGAEDARDAAAERIRLAENPCSTVVEQASKNEASNAFDADEVGRHEVQEDLIGR
jgi:hypothetical protein